MSVVGYIIPSIGGFFYQRHLSSPTSYRTLFQYHFSERRKSTGHKEYEYTSSIKSVYIHIKVFLDIKTVYIKPPVKILLVIVRRSLTH